MDCTLQIHGERRVYPVPDGLPDLLTDITREVLRAKPVNINLFIADYLNALIETRKFAAASLNIVDEVEDNFKQFLDYLRGIGTTFDEANKAATIIQAYYRGFKTRKQLGMASASDEELGDVNILDDIFDYLDERGITFIQATLAATIIQSAYRGYRARKAFKESTAGKTIRWVPSHESWRHDWILEEFGMTWEEIQKQRQWELEEEEEKHLTYLPNRFIKFNREDLQKIFHGDLPDYSDSEADGKYNIDCRKGSRPSITGSHKGSKKSVESVKSLSGARSAKDTVEAERSSSAISKKSSSRLSMKSKGESLLRKSDGGSEFERVEEEELKKHPSMKSRISKTSLGEESRKSASRSKSEVSDMAVHEEETEDVRSQVSHVEGEEGETEDARSQVSHVEGEEGAMTDGEVSVAEGETSAVELESAPTTDAESAPPTDAESAPQTDAESAPPTDVESAPPTDVESAPETGPESAPATDAESAPPTDDESAPPNEAVSAPATDAESAPSTDTESVPPLQTETEPESALQTETETATTTEAETEPESGAE